MAAPIGLPPLGDEMSQGFDILKYMLACAAGCLGGVGSAAWWGGRTNTRLDSLEESQRRVEAKLDRLIHLLVQRGLRISPHDED